MRLALLAALVLAACAGEAPRGDPAVPSRFARSLAAGAPEAGLFDAAVLHFVNRARAVHGRAPLSADPRLARAAARHAGNMAELRRHSHRLPLAGEGRLVERMDRQGVRFRVAGENIGMEKLYRLAGRPIAVGAAGCRFTYADTREAVPVHTTATLAEAAVARWMASPKHRAAILSGDFRRTGSGFGIDPGGPACGDVYLVQTFAD